MTGVNPSHNGYYTNIAQISSQILLEDLLSVQSKILKITSMINPDISLSQDTLSQIRTIIVGLHERQKELINELTKRKVL